MFVSPRLTGRARGSAVFISSTATVCRHGGAKGQRGGGGGCMTVTCTRVCKADGDQYLRFQSGTAETISRWGEN